MLTVEGVVPFLRTHGLIPEAQVVDGNVLVQNASRRNLNFKVVDGTGTGYLVKQGVGVEKSHTVAREAAAYRFFGSQRRFEPLMPCLPRCYAYDREQSALILEFVGDSESVSDYHRRRGQFPAGIGHALGQTLGMLHRLSERGAAPPGPAAEFPEPTPRLVHLYEHLREPSLETFTQMSEAARALVKIVQDSVELWDRLAALRRDWRDEAVIHGDFRWDNCRVVRPSLTGGRARVTVVDWELAGLGDPCWDVGTVFAEYLTCWIRSMPMISDTAPDVFTRLAWVPLTRLHPAVRAFWRAYVRARALDPAAASASLVRATRYAGACAILNAYADMRDATRLNAHAIYLLQLSLNMLDRPLEAAVQLLNLPRPII